MKFKKEQRAKKTGGPQEKGQDSDHGSPLGNRAESVQTGAAHSPPMSWGMQDGPVKQQESVSPSGNFNYPSVLPQQNRVSPSVQPEFKFYGEEVQGYGNYQNPSSVSPIQIQEHHQQSRYVDREVVYNQSERHGVSVPEYTPNVHFNDIPNTYAPFWNNYSYSSAYSQAYVNAGGNVYPEAYPLPDLPELSQYQQQHNLRQHQQHVDDSGANFEDTPIIQPPEYHDTQMSLTHL